MSFPALKATRATRSVRAAILLMAAWLSAVAQRPLPTGDQRDTIGAAVTWTVAPATPSIRCGTHAPPPSFDCVRAIRVPDPHRVERVRIRSAPPLVVLGYRVSPYYATAPPTTSRSI